MSFLQRDLKDRGQNTIKMHLIVLMAESADKPKCPIYEDGPIDCPEMADRSYHSTLRKIPKIAGLIDIVAEAWNQKRVYFEF